MKITHEFLNCLSCGKKIEVLDEDWEENCVVCPDCDYINVLTDSRIERWEEDF
jgi:DNA-directed RNA polymerase subunit RPC12/RpoP